jgi:hypothetical protein
MLSNEFNHYDLHGDNVVLYRLGNKQANRDRVREIAVGGVPNNGQYITMKYHYPDGEVVSFNTFEIAKIIDYGRCYFSDTDKKNNVVYSSHNYHQFLRTAIKANDAKRTTKKLPSSREAGDYTKEQCHNESYNELEDEGIYGSYHYICSNKRNKSHDLRLVSIIRRELLNEYRNKEKKWAVTYFDVAAQSKGKRLVRKILEALYYKNEYQLNRGRKDEGYGTAEVEESSYDSLDTLKSEASIKNVEDMHLTLKDLLRTEYFQQMNTELFKTYQKIGEMNIYMDGSKSLQYTAEGSKI